MLRAVRLDVLQLKLDKGVIIFNSQYLACVRQHARETVGFYMGCPVCQIYKKYYQFNLKIVCETRLRRHEDRYYIKCGISNETAQLERTHLFRSRLKFYVQRSTRREEIFMSPLCYICVHTKSQQLKHIYYAYAMTFVGAINYYKTVTDRCHICGIVANITC